MNKYIVFYRSKGVFNVLMLESFESLDEARQSVIKKIKDGYAEVRIAQEMPITLEVKI